MSGRTITVQVGAVTMILQLLNDGETIVLAAALGDADAAEGLYGRLAGCLAMAETAYDLFAESMVEGRGPKIESYAELLAALKEADARFELGGYPPDISPRDKIRAAIAQAEG